MRYISIQIIGIYASCLLSTVFSASIHKQEIIRKKRDGEIFDEHFLPGHSVHLSVPVRAQTQQYTCGPTVAFALLQYLGYRSLSTDLDGEISGNLCIDGLIINMWTEPYAIPSGGTDINDFVNTINRYIIRNNLNNLRRYNTIHLAPSILQTVDLNRIDYNSHFWRIARYVYNSLLNRAPVVLGFRGRFNGFEPIRNHFILLYGITITENGASFSYMDPDGGRYGTFQHNQLNHLLQNGGVLVAHTPSHTPTGNPRNCPAASAFGGTAGMTGGIIAGGMVGSAVPVIGTLVGGLFGAAGGFVTGAVGAAVACLS